MPITFNDLCVLLEEVEKITTRQPRLAPKSQKEVIRKRISNWFANHRETLDGAKANGGALLSAMFPHRRKDRVYGLQPPRLSKKIAKSLNFNKCQVELFEEWPTSRQGDLGSYTQRAMRTRDGTFRTRPLVPIERVDALMTQLAARYRFSDPAIQQQRDWTVDTDSELKYILTRLESWEAKWLVRLILREYSTIELEERYVFRQYHFLLPDLLQFQNDYDAAFSMLSGELSMYPSVLDASLQTQMRIQASSKLKPVIGIKVSRPPFYKAWSFKHCFQMVSTQAWAAEVKYDGEYCEVHVDLNNATDEIKIFSKNGKDATIDRQVLHRLIRKALRIGRVDCQIQRNCIVLGEMVLYSDREKKILPFSKIRKHIKRSGSFLGTLQDSLPHDWEHLMLVFFDVLMLDDEPIMRKNLQERRKTLRDIVQIIPGRSQRSHWTLIDFKDEHGVTDLKQVFAHSLASRQEGIVLKPLHVPYFPLLTEGSSHQLGYFIKLKKDYLGDMGGERDLGDFAIIGACYDPRLRSKTDLRPLFWTHFHLACLLNKTAVQRTMAKPIFKVVGCLSLEKCIPKSELKYLNITGQFQQVSLREDGSTDLFDIDHGLTYIHRMTTAFKQPFVAEILGGGYEKVQNETFEMLRHPRIKKVHHDRTWEDAVTLEELEQMANEKWDIPSADKLDGHAKDVAILAKKYAKEMGGSQSSTSNYETTQETSQASTWLTARASTPDPPTGAVVQESQEGANQDAYVAASSSPFSYDTQGDDLRASIPIHVLVREDTSERLEFSDVSRPHKGVPIPSTRPSSSEAARPVLKKRNSSRDTISPPNKRRKNNRSPLKDARGNRNLGSFSYDSQEKTIHIYVEEGWQVQVHSGLQQN